MNPASGILLCAATGVEARACTKGVRGTGIEVLATGMGASHAAEKLRARLLSPDRELPRLVISAGFAGWAGDAAGVASWVLGSGVSAGGGERLALATAELETWLATSGLLWRKSEVFSTERVVSAARFSGGEGALDMESFALAKVARDFAIEVGVLRMVSDTPGEPIPEAVASFSGFSLASDFAEGCAQLWRGTREALRRPGELSRFLARGTRLPRLLSEGWKALTGGLRAR